MSRSDAPREKLLKPWHLFLAIVGFAAAFVWIAPARHALTLQDSVVETGISELDVAYLKAERASAQQSGEDVVKAATALVRAGRIEEAEMLLADRPDVRMSKQDELALRIERLMVKYHQTSDPDDSATASTAVNTIKANESDLGGNDGVRGSLENSIVVALQDVQRSTEATQVTLLKRSAELAVRFEEFTLAAGITKRLVDEDKDNHQQWLTECIRLYEFIENFVEASQCAGQQLEIAETPDDTFNAKLALLRLASKAKDDIAVDGYVKDLHQLNSDSTENLGALAVQLLAIERPLDASRTFAKLAKQDSEQQAEWLKKASRWAEAGGKPDEAAAYLDLYRESSSANFSVEEKSELEDDIARLLGAAGNRDALVNRYAAKIESGDRSKETLDRGIVAAIGHQKLHVAQQWNNLLLEHFPDAVQAWVNQYDISLALSELPQALTAARTLVDLQPDVAEQRIRLARVAEWSGDPEGATKHWLWLSERFPTSQVLTELTRLSIMTRQPTIAAEALRRSAMQSRPSTEQLTQLIDAYELEGRPDRAAQVIEELMARYGSDAATLIRLAKLHEHHVNFGKAAEVWARYDDIHAPSVQSQLHRMEVSWRLNKAEAAKGFAKNAVRLAAGDARALDVITDYQTRLLAEIGWRYELPQVTAKAQTQLSRIADENQQLLYRKRAIASAKDQDNLLQAIAAAKALYDDTDSDDAAILHMRLLVSAIRKEPTHNGEFLAALEPYLVANNETVSLRRKIEYWSLAAQYHLSQGEPLMAERAYQSGLNQAPKNTGSLAGLLWLYIGGNRVADIRTFVGTYETLAESSPALWTPFAMAYMQLGMPRKSLTWFDRQIDTIEADYGLLLTYADALEASGQAGQALKVRHYAIDALRPLLADNITNDTKPLLQQYARMVNRFGNADQKERFTQGVLADSSEDMIPKDEFWQQEMAISWLMATQRDDMARVVLAKLHEQRLKAPAWQALAVALKQNELDIVAQIVQSGEGISVGDNILALRRLGRGNEAYDLAVQTLQAGLAGNGSQMAAESYRALKMYRPGFAGASIENTLAPGIGILESSVVARHTFDNTTLGISVDAKNQTFDSTRYLLSEDNERQDIAVTLHYGDAAFNTEFTAGYVRDETADRAYAKAKLSAQFAQGKHGVNVELATNETPTASTVLRLRGQQSRASAGVNVSIGRQGFAQLSATATDITTRVAEQKVARGLSGQLEFGIRGTIGSHTWSGSVMASSQSTDRADDVPQELMLNDQVNMNEVIARQGSTVSIGGSLARGGIASNYPQVSSPRYFVNARVGHQWPEKSFGFQFGAGAGVRVIGGDELSVGFSHDGLVNDLVGQGRSRLGVNYRFHF